MKKQVISILGGCNKSNHPNRMSARRVKWNLSCLPNPYIGLRIQIILMKKKENARENNY